MFGLDQTLLIRALNTTRQSYFPTYVGLRLIADQLPPGENAYLQRLIRRRLFSGDAWRFKQFDLYKGSSTTPAGVEHIYRDCLAPSPLTAIAESFVLALLAQHSAFSVPSRVYSYRWPSSSRSGGSYEFFVEGYKQRNGDIADGLSVANHVAVVTDIKRFYPSICPRKIDSILKSLLDKSDEDFKPWRDPIIGFFSQLLSAGSHGIPIGPASSHVLGHLILRDVDHELTSNYGTNYYRYVDDIVVVCHEDQVDKVKRDIQRSVERQGLALNTDKTNVIGRIEWQRSIMRPDISDEDSFRSFSTDLTVYLAFHPERAESMKKMLAEGGLSIPVERLRALSAYPRFRYFLSRRKARSGLSHALGLFFASNRALLDRGLRLKGLYESALSSLLDEPVEFSGRRWQLQRARRVINSLFYLRHFSEWNVGRGTFDTLPELAEQAALAEALSTGLATPVLPYYGRGPAAFSELWVEHGQSDVKLLSSDNQANTAEVDALITLRLYGLIPAERVESLRKQYNSRLLCVVNRANASARTTLNLSFEDEFESLRLGVTDQEFSVLARTRYAQSEGAALQALSLFGSEYRS